ncbi:MAG TPA: lytic transglycosylase domain-containing protein [Candidatus Baltobacteraceae bacterium]|nr:lytic transglycosylase domain-containing protein [Candidatus Baltobacteraceae bacterium]
MISRPFFGAMLLAGVAAAVAAPAARADYAVLRNGMRLHITGYQQQGDHVELTVQGGTVEISSAELIDVEPEDQFPAPPPADVDFGVRYSKLIHAAAEKHGVDEKLIAQVIAAESNFDAKAVSRKRALGLMQLLRETAARYDVVNVFDPAQNIDAGTHYLKDLLARYRGNLSLALAAYNAGPEMVDRYGGIPPFPETQNYVREITSKLSLSASGK